MHITLCDLVATWDSLSPTQKKSLNQRYQMGCECKVSAPSQDLHLGHPCGWVGGGGAGWALTTSALRRSHAASPSRASSPPRMSASGQIGRWRRSWAGGRPSTTPASRGATAHAPGTAAWPPRSRSFSTSRTPKPSECIPVASRKAQRDVRLVHADIGAWRQHENPHSPEGPQGTELPCVHGAGGGHCTAHTLHHAHPAAGRAAPFPAG